MKILLGIIIVIIGIIVYRKYFQEKIKELLIKVKPKNEKNSNDFEDDVSDKSFTYEKKCLMTNIEKQYYSAIKSSVSEQYVVQAQVNLASVINKSGSYRFQNELFRNVDFGIFDENFNLIVLIEINDRSHEHYARRERDTKVRNIIEIAKIPMITLHTKYGVNQEYIAKRIQEYIP